MASNERSFPTTRWTLILELKDPGNPQRARALDELCRLYWYPIYAHIRQRGRRPEDAEDLTQAFFLHVLENASFDRAEESRGRLRSFLLGALKRFLSKERRRDTAEKRGGGVSALSLDLAIEEGEARYAMEPVDSDDPEKIFHRRWAQTVIAAAQAKLQEEYLARERAELHQTLQPYLFGNDGEAPYQEVAEQLGLSVEAVRSAVLRLRKRFAAILREQIGFTVDDPGQVDAEIRELFAAFRNSP